MSASFKIIGSIVIAIAMLAFFVVCALYRISYNLHSEEGNELIGLYTVDSSSLGKYDIYIDKRMSVEFKTNKRFKLIHAMPNICDTLGTWSLGGIDAEAPNNICYGLDETRCCHVTRCFKEGNDSIMYMGILFKYEYSHAPITIKFRKINRK